ncbi:MAG: hypothetical protein LBF19_05575 [Prevotellaceae bacterium]|nr:hypothetical protein [Prevotellaceae bacterium]
MNTHKLSLIAIVGMLASMIFFTACKDDPADVPVEAHALSVDVTTFDAPYTGGEYNVTVTGNCEWSVTVDDFGSTWCTATPASGEGNGTVNIVVAANTMEERPATVTIRSVNTPEVVLKYPIKIRQESINNETGVLLYGTTWATRNVNNSGYFTLSPGDAGQYYQYGNPNPGADADYVPFFSEWSGTLADPCPEGWRMPTEAEIMTLTRDLGATISWRTANDADNYGVEGLWIGEKAAEANAADPQGCLFLPAAGYIDPNTGELVNKDDDNVWHGYYYGGTSNSRYSDLAFPYLAIGGPLYKGGLHFSEVSTYHLICPPMSGQGLGDTYIATTLRCVKQQ